MLKLILKTTIIFFIITIGTFLLYFNNTRLVDPKTAGYYKELKQTLLDRGYKARLLVISTRRFKFDNYLLMKISQAIPTSRHMYGEAIDFLVFDINLDGKIDAKDVDLAHQILSEDIIRGRGSIGVYKNKKGLTRQMIHIDCYQGRKK